MGMSYIYLKSEDMDKLKAGEGVAIPVIQYYMSKTDTLILRVSQEDKKPEAPKTPDKWEQIKELIDDAMEKRDRSVSLHFNPDTGMSVNVRPWPDADDLYEQYEKGRITANDFRVKMGLPLVKNAEQFMKKG